MEAIDILILDDEASILKALKRLLMRKGAKVHTFEDPHEALSFLKNQSVQVVISDMRMPIMTGAQFLKEVKEIQPMATRIVLSGFSERESLLKAINEGHIWRFLSKPWDNDDLFQTIQNAHELYQSKAEREALIHELEERKQELEAWNENLEKCVAQRTKELKVRSDFLENIVNCDQGAEAMAMSAFDELSGHVGHRFCGPREKGFPLRKGRDVLGHIVLPGTANDEDPLYSSFAPLLSLLLSQGKTEITEEIDAWLEEMG